MDLNRNFPRPRGIKPKSFLAGSDKKISFNYMGPYPLSEPESMALDKFIKKHRFFVAVNFHTTGSYFAYPWAYKDGPMPHKDFYLQMGKVFNEHQKMRKYTVLQSFAWYQTVGELDDWLYGRYGALSFTVEVAAKDKRLINPIRFVNPFWWFNPTNIEEWIENDRDATLHAIEKAHELTGGNPVPVQKIDWVVPKGYITDQ